MSVIGSNILAGASGQGGGYNLTRSLRFRSSASAYLSRTPASAGNRKTWTWSGWVKRGAVDGQYRCLFEVGTSTPWFGLLFSNSNFDNKIQISFSSGVSPGTATTAEYRDPSSWYHIVLAVDTTQATDTNRVKLYVNGVQVTSFSNTNYPSQNYDTQVNSTVLHTIGNNSRNLDSYFDGYLTEINFIDGQALTPSSFGETNAQTGVWQPKKYAGTYGTNGFYLPFTDNSALTSGSNAGLGKDFSGNGNYWTTNNISITSGVTYDSMTDVPTLTSATASNFAVMNPLNTGGASISEGNTLVDSNGATHRVTFGTMALPSSGKWYWEQTSGLISSSRIGCGMATSSLALTGFPFSTAGTYAWYYGDSSNNLYWESNGTTDVFSVAGANGDILQFCYDADNGTLYAGKNNVFYSSTGATTGSPSTLTNPTSSGISSTNQFFPIVSNYDTGAFRVNFGQRPFAYTPPTGFVALNTFNLPTPTIGATASTQANKYFDATLYTGTGSSQSIVNAGSFPPALVWLKRRSAAESHGLWDTVRGGSLRLESNTTGAESSTTDRFSGITSTGFTVTGSDPQTNASGSTYVGWQWRADGTSSGSSNTDGSITSTVSANTSAGFSVVTYTGNGTSGATIGHGLGVAPNVIITKSRTSAPSSNDWKMYHSALGTTQSIYLNLTNAAATSTMASAVSSTTWTTGSSAGAASNENGINYVAYCFSEVAGYSKFGSYTGNGSSDGTFVYTGFKPKYVMIKSSNAVNSWVIEDTSRDTYNACGLDLFAESSGAEVNNIPRLDIVSNGFKLRNTYSGSNASGTNYIFMAFAENPFKYSLAR
jgi:hypothetical protein